MTKLHCTYPDGETAEALFDLPLDSMIALYDPFYCHDEDTEVDIPAFIDAA